MKKILAVLLILSVSFVVAGCNNVFSMTKESTTESTTNETTTDDNTTEETTTEEYYYLDIYLNADTDYMIENGYAEMENGYIYVVDRAVVMEELLDWGDISSDEYFHTHGGTCDGAMSWIFFELKCDRETAENIFEIISSKAIVENAGLANGRFAG